MMIRTMVGVTPGCGRCYVVNLLQLAGSISNS